MDETYKGIEENGNAIIVKSKVMDSVDLGYNKIVVETPQLDEDGNVVNGNVVTVNTKNCVIEGADKLIATVGLRDMIVVDTKDATLISTKENAGEIKKVLASLREAGKNEYL